MLLPKVYSQLEYSANNTVTRHGPELSISRNLGGRQMPSLRESLSADQAIARQEHVDRQVDQTALPPASKRQLREISFSCIAAMGSSSSKPSNPAPHVWKGYVSKRFLRALQSSGEPLISDISRTPQPGVSQNLVEQLETSNEVSSSLALHGSELIQHLDLP